MNNAERLFRRFSRSVEKRIAPSVARDRGREALRHLEQLVYDVTDHRMPHHLVRLTQRNRGFSSYHDDVAVMRYVGRDKDLEFFIDDDTEAITWQGRLFKGKASLRRPVTVVHVTPDELTDALVRRVIRAAMRIRRSPGPEYRIPRGYYPYGYFSNYKSGPPSRRRWRCHYNKGVIRAKNFREARKKLKQDIASYVRSVDSMYMMTSGGRQSLEPTIDGKRSCSLGSEFTEKGRIVVRFGRYSRRTRMLRAKRKK